MIGEYLRLTEAELDRAIRDPAWALGYADAVSDAIDLDDDLIDEEEAAAWDGVDAAFARTRRYTTDKAWDAIRYLLRRAGCPVDVTGGESGFTADDWGYGPARYLTAERVRVAADFLRDVPFTTLVAGMVTADLDAAEVYPLSWDANALIWVGTVHEGLAAFFATAANDGDAMLVWRRSSPSTARTRSNPPLHADADTINAVVCRVLLWRCSPWRHPARRTAAHRR